MYNSNLNIGASIIVMLLVVFFICFICWYSDTSLQYCIAVLAKIPASITNHIIFCHINISIAQLWPLCEWSFIKQWFTDGEKIVVILWKLLLADLNKKKILDTGSLYKHYNGLLLFLILLICWKKCAFLMKRKSLLYLIMRHVRRNTVIGAQMFKDVSGLGNSRLFTQDLRSKLNNKAALTPPNAVYIKDFNSSELCNGVLICIFMFS